jgi:hypothetical protein
MLYRHITHHALAHLKASTRFDSLLAETTPILASFRQQMEQNQFDLLTIPGRQDDFVLMEQVAETIRSHFSHLVILGTGGSALNGQALTSLATASGHPQLHFVDNVDPHTIDQLFRALDIPHTAFLAISKSGKTVETLSQMLVAIQAVEKSVGKTQLGQQFFVLSDPGDNPIRRLGASIKWAPASTRMRATVLLPLPMPPVRPMRIRPSPSSRGRVAPPRTGRPGRRPPGRARRAHSAPHATWH